MIYVTHDQVEAMTLGQRIIVLNEGVVQQIDAPMRIYEQPANLFVAGFLGNPAMNLWRGRLERSETGPALTGKNARLPLDSLERSLLPKLTTSWSWASDRNTCCLSKRSGLNN